jgi:cellulose synthase/poly-beta-1,6-N-acetylglucosamine synthase-like glycosyltransferase
MTLATNALALSPLPLVPVLGYLSCLTAAAWYSPRTRPEPSDHCSTRFTVLIPAHNEQQLIAQTIASIQSAEYPSELISIHVIADHCTDQTAVLARRHGAEVHHHEDPHPPGKGPALQWATDQLLERGVHSNAIVIIDADSVVNTEFFTVIDAHLAAGAEVVQAYYAVRDHDTSVNTGLRAAALTVRHHLRSAGRTTLGGSCGLFGNGMAFTTAIMRNRSWSTHLTEDLEFQLELLIDEVRVDYAPGAVLEAEMPATLDGSRSQHERWERGRIDLAQKFVPILFRRAIRARGGHRIALIDAMIDLVVPPVSVIAAATAGTGTLTATMHVLRPSAMTRLGMSAWLFVSTSLVFSVLSGLRLTRSPPSVYRSLLGAPRVVIWKVALWFRMINQPSQVSWDRTARNAE